MGLGPIALANAASQQQFLDDNKAMDLVLRGELTLDDVLTELRGNDERKEPTTGQAELTNSGKGGQSTAGKEAELP